MNIRMFFQERFRGVWNEDEKTPQQDFVGRSMSYRVRGLDIVSEAVEPYIAIHESIAFASVPEGVGDLINRITLHDDFTTEPPRKRGLYELRTAQAELELNERVIGVGLSQEFVRRYKLELVAKGTDAEKMLEDVRELYLGIKEGKIEPKHDYEAKSLGSELDFPSLTSNSLKTLEEVEPL